MKDQNLPRRFFILEPGLGKTKPWDVTPYMKLKRQTHTQKLADHMAQLAHYRNSLNKGIKP